MLLGVPSPTEGQASLLPPHDAIQETKTVKANKNFKFFILNIIILQN